MATSRLSPVSVPMLPFQWKQGEHMVIIGSTGTGKTTITAQLLQARAAVISLCTKADDSNKLLPNDMPRNRHIRHVSEIGRDPRLKRFVLEPRLGEQAQEAYKLYERVWREGRWTLYTDELFYLEQELKLGKFNRMLLTQGRSKQITMVNGIQRPAFVNRFALSEPTHVVCGRVEPRDLKTVVDATTAIIKEPLSKLRRYEFLWYHRAENRWAVIDLERIKGDGEQGGTTEEEK